MHLTASHRDRYRAFVLIASVTVALLGTLVLVGWVTDTRILTSLLPGVARTKFNEAIALVLAGLSLALVARESPDAQTGPARTASEVAAIATAAIGVLTLLQYGGQWDFGFDQLLYGENDPPEEQIAGRMSVISAFVFSLTGAAIFLLARNMRARWVEGLTLIAIFNALIPVIGYLYGKAALYQIPYYGTVGLPMAVAFLLLCAGILAARPERGVMSLVSNRSAGGITARRLLPAAILLPVVIVRWQYWGYEADIYDATFAMISITLASMIVFTILILWNARLLLRLDGQRGEAEDTVREALDVLESNLNALSASNKRVIAEAGERRAIEESLFHEHERAQVTLNAIVDGVITTDMAGRIMFLNPAGEALTGWRSDEAAGKHIREIVRMVDPVTREPIAYAVEDALAAKPAENASRNCILLNRDGKEFAVTDSCTPIHGRDGNVIGAVLVLHDVSAEHAMAVKMSYLSQHDVLTDLPNRFLLNDRLTQATGLALLRNSQVSVLFLDLDRFKHVNDTLGHTIGDYLLKEIAARLKACMRDTDTIARYGGDEFVVLLQEAGESFGVAKTAAQLLAAIAEPYHIEGHELHITGSIGISIFPDDGEDSQTLIKHAEVAMYQAKAQGRNNYQFFLARVNERAVQRFAIEARLRTALAREESALYYQPKFSISEGKVMGAEALIRWHGGARGSVAPSQFIPIAEESGLIVPIGEWVLRKACMQNRAWQDAGYEPLSIAVNVSAVQFRDKNFLDMLSHVLEESRLDPRYLELELTETVIMQDLEVTVPLLEALKRMGVSLAIDDFGTGYSSLSYLKRFPIDALKIDRSFVQDIATDPDDAAITCAIISMAKSLKQRVIAEGVETVEQFEFLRKNGCDIIQGFYFSPPLTAADFETRILRHADAVTPQ